MKTRTGRALLGALLAMGLACGPYLVSPSAFQRYLEGADPAVKAACAMENGGQSRAGWCVVRGEPAAVARWLRALDARPSTTGPAACAAIPEVAGGAVLEVGPGRPPNTDNVRPSLILVAPAGDVACVELSYPYG